MRLQFASPTRPGILLLLLAASICAALADDLPPEVLQLSRFKQGVRRDIERLANCTCLETMERSAQTPGSNSFQFLDRVRLEVTHTGGKELWAWPGGASFDQVDVKSFVGSGLVASGMFVSQARFVFMDNRSTFHYVGAEDLENRRAIRYDYRIPAMEGAYKLGSGGNSAWVASKGSFWFDPDSLALIRLDVSADEIPGGLGISGALTRIRYAQMHAAAGDFLAPEEVEVVLRHPTGEARRNTIHFAHCREYKADSSISFNAPGPQAGTPTEADARVEVPAGLTIRMELEDGLDWTTAAIGDPVRARVSEDVRRGGGTILPKGAIASGRVSGMVRPSKGDGFLVSIELTEMQWGKSRAELHAKLLETQGDGQVKPLSGKQNDASNITGLAGGSISSETLTVLQPTARKGGPKNPDVCTLWLKDSQWHVAAGLRLRWRTVAP